MRSFCHVRELPVTHDLDELYYTGVMFVAVALNILMHRAKFIPR